MTKHIQHEAEEQKALFEWAAAAKGKYPELDLLFHIPNGGSRNVIEASNLKRQGVKKGVPDLFLPVARGKYHGLFIELKWGKNKPSPEQKEWIRNIRKQNYAALVCYGWEEAAEVLKRYLEVK